MRVAIVNGVWTDEAATPEASLDRFPTLTGWAEATRRAGADVAVFQCFRAAATIERGGIAYRFIAAGGAPRPAVFFAGPPALLDALAAWAPDVVHINGLDYPRLIRAIRRRLPRGAAIAVQDHGGFDPRRLSFVRSRWMRFGLSAADALLVASAHQIEPFKTSGLLPPSTRVIDVMEGSTTLRADRFEPHERARAVLWVGRLDANKDPLTVLEGFRAWARDDATLTFVYSTTGLEAALRAAVARDERLRSCVRLAGFVPHEELSGYYAAADLFVLGSHREGSGYAAIEALAFGVVPVLTDIPSFRTLTDDGQVGALWRCGDAGSLTAALDRVASAPLPPQRRAARALFERSFSWDAIGQRAAAIYRDMSRC